jgi:hypothetical protein
METIALPVALDLAAILPVESCKVSPVLICPFPDTLSVPLPAASWSKNPTFMGLQRGVRYKYVLPLGLAVGVSQQRT